MHLMCVSTGDAISCVRYTWCRAFLASLNELNDYAGQHELVAENMTSQIITELTRYTQDLKAERKSVSNVTPTHTNHPTNPLQIVNLYLRFIHSSLHASIHPSIDLTDLPNQSLYIHPAFHPSIIQSIQLYNTLITFVHPSFILTHKASIHHLFFYQTLPPVHLSTHSSIHNTQTIHP